MSYLSTLESLISIIATIVLFIGSQLVWYNPPPLLLILFDTVVGIIG